MFSNISVCSSAQDTKKRKTKKTRMLNTSNAALDINNTDAAEFRRTASNIEKNHLQTCNSHTRRLIQMKMHTTVAAHSLALVFFRQFYVHQLEPYCTFFCAAFFLLFSFDVSAYYYIHIHHVNCSTRCVCFSTHRLDQSVCFIVWWCVRASVYDMFHFGSPFSTHSQLYRLLINYFHSHTQAVEVSARLY